MKYIGIDNGLNGALVVIEDNKIIEKRVMPILTGSSSRREYDLVEIIKFLERYEDSTAIIEKAHAMPSLGTVQAFNFGKEYGMMLGILAALKIRYHIVHAKTWQKEMFRDTAANDTKQASAIVAQRLFPREDFTATTRSKKIHDGLTDAALLSAYGERKRL